MAAEDVVTSMPALSTEAMHPEPEPPENVPTSMPLLATPTEEVEDDDPALRGIVVLDRPREVLFSVTLKFRMADLPHWQPSMDFDQPRDLTDDE